MRVVVQRVRNAEVAVPETGYSATIGSGLLLLAAFIDEDTEVRVHFKSFEDFETYSDVICEYVETEDPDAAPGEGAGSLGYITLKFKELPSDIGLLELMVYCRGFYIGTPWND